MPPPSSPVFRLGIYVFKDAEIVDLSRPPRRLLGGPPPSTRSLGGPSLIADAMPGPGPGPASRCCPTTASPTGPAMDRLLIPGGLRHPQELHTSACTPLSGSSGVRRMLTSVSPAPGSTGPWGCSTASPPPTARSPTGWRQTRPQGPDRSPADIAPLPDQPARGWSDQGPIVTAGGICSGWRWAFQLLRRAGYEEGLNLRGGEGDGVQRRLRALPATTWKAEAAVRRRRGRHEWGQSIAFSSTGRGLRWTGRRVEVVATPARPPPVPRPPAQLGRGLAELAQRTARRRARSREAALARLHALLLRAARFEITPPRGMPAHLRGDAFEDIAVEDRGTTP